MKYGNRSNRNFIRCNFEQPFWKAAILKGDHFEGQPFLKIVLLGCMSKIYKKFLVVQRMKIVFQVFEHISILKSFLHNHLFEMPSSWIKSQILAGPLGWIFSPEYSTIEEIFMLLLQIPNSPWNMLQICWTTISSALPVLPAVLLSLVYWFYPPNVSYYLGFC